MKTLVVDDNPTARQGLCLLLQMNAGMTRVYQATGGYEALVLARRLRPDLVLLDLQMPGMDGLEVARQLRQMDGIHIVAMSMDPALREEALAAGAHDFVDKIELGYKLASMAGRGPHATDGAGTVGFLLGGPRQL